MDSPLSPRNKTWPICQSSSSMVSWLLLNFVKGLMLQLNFQLTLSLSFYFKKCILCRDTETHSVPLRSTFSSARRHEAFLFLSLTAWIMEAECYSSNFKWISLSFWNEQLNTFCSHALKYMFKNNSLCVFSHSLLDPTIHAASLLYSKNLIDFISQTLKSNHLE